METLDLAELNHRTANSYQAMAAFIAAERRRAPEAGELLDRLGGQLQAFGLVHRLLEPDRGGLRLVAADNYLRALCTHLERACLRPRNAVLETRFEPALLDPALCQRLGLIVTELVLNAAKHAFVERERGRVEVGFSLSRDAEAAVWVADDGPGFDFGADASPSGLGFVSQIVRRLGGSLGYQSSAEGARIVARVPGSPSAQVGEVS